jgi:hypothetical protein
MMNGTSGPVSSGFYQGAGKKIDAASLGLLEGIRFFLLKCYYRNRTVITRPEITDICSDYCD